jgi:cytochrome P450
MTAPGRDLPPKPVAREERVSLWRYMRLFRRDILSAQPERLYRAWMAEFRTPFFRSFLVNQPDLVEEILKVRPRAFPKSDRVGEGLRPLLGASVFLTNGETWARQRRIIDPAFEGGRLKDTFGAMLLAGEALLERMGEGEQDIEPVMSHAAADVIFRTLFSIPIEDRIAAEVFREFRAYQRSQPILNLRAFLPLPRWMPRGHRRETLRAARRIRALITDLTLRRVAEIAAGHRARRPCDEDPDGARPRDGRAPVGGGDGGPGRDLLPRGARDERQCAELDALPPGALPRVAGARGRGGSGPARRHRGRAISRGCP